MNLVHFSSSVSHDSQQQDANQRFPVALARSLGTSDRWSSVVTFGAKTKGSSSVLPSSEDVLSDREIAEGLAPSVFGPGFVHAQVYADAAESKQLEFSPFTLGLMMELERLMGAMLTIETVEADTQMKIEDVGFNVPEAKKELLHSRKQVLDAMGVLLPAEAQHRKLKWAVVQDVLMTYNHAWKEYNQEILSGSVQQQAEDNDVSSVASPTEEPTGGKWKNKLRNYFSFNAPLWRNPLTHAFIGAALGGFVTPFVPLTMALVMGIGLFMTPSQPNAQSQLERALSRTADQLRKKSGHSSPMTLSDSLARVLTVYMDRNQMLETQKYGDYLKLLTECGENPEGVPKDVLKAAEMIQAFKARLTEAVKAGDAAEDLEEGSLEDYQGRLAVLTQGDEPEISPERARYIKQLIKQLQKEPPFSQNGAVISKKINWLLRLPNSSKELKTFDSEKAREILDSEHYDLDKVKQKIIDTLGAEHFVKGVPVDPKDKKPVVICLQGPPGVGKTSIGESIARATGRDFVKVSLGGVSKESDIRGHDMAFLGSEPGKIIQALVKAGSDNPVMMLDEIDKLGESTQHGDPTAALLEVLDSDNTAFRDNFLGTEVDLSKVMFVCTANYLERIHPTLLNRMNVIKLPGYITEDKLQIAKDYVVPRTRRRYGLTRDVLQDKGLLNAESKVKAKEPFTLSDDVLRHLITQGYSPGLGVRTLEEVIDDIGKKTANAFGKKSAASKVLTPADFKPMQSVEALRKQGYIDRPPFPIEKVTAEKDAGIVNGLFYSDGARSGGTLPITVDVHTVPKGAEPLTMGDIQLKLNDSAEEAINKGWISRVDMMGNLQGVMKESVAVALTYIKNNWNVIEPHLREDYKDKSLALSFYVEDLAVPKDGPSATAAFTMAIISALTGTPVRGDFAMTGEMNTRGSMKPIGGVREKVVGAREEGVTQVVVPAKNEDAYLEDVPEPVQSDLQYRAPRHIVEVMDFVWGETKPELVDAFKSGSVGYAAASAPALRFAGTIPVSNPFAQVAS